MIAEEYFLKTSKKPTWVSGVLEAKLREVPPPPPDLTELDGRGVGE